MADSNSLMIAWQLADKDVLLVGAGKVAYERLEKLIFTNARVTIVSPKESMDPKMAKLIEDNAANVNLISRTWHESDVEGKDMVFSAIDNTEVSKSIAYTCRIQRIPVNVADVPNLCDFYFGSEIIRGPLQIMVSTNGQSPRIANIIRKQIEASLPHDIAKSINNFGTLRKRIREICPGTTSQDVRRRMQWLTKLCDEWQLQGFADLTEEDMGRLIIAFETNTIPKHEPKRTFSFTSRIIPLVKSISNDMYSGFLLGFTIGGLLALYARKTYKL